GHWRSTTRQQPTMRRHILEKGHAGAGAPEEVPAIHRRAAEWYLEQHSIGDALRHLVAGQCWSEAAQVLEQHALPMLQEGDVARVLRWLRQLQSLQGWLSPQ